MKIKDSTQKTKHAFFLTVRFLFEILKLTAFSVITGAFGGIIGALFNITIEYATEFRGEYKSLIFFLPIAGILIALFYRLCKVKHDRGTNLIIEAVANDKFIPLYTAPIVLISTSITHLFGGSSGKEGAALQIGGELGELACHLLHLRRLDRKLAVLCGMSAMFAALFGTPIAAAIYVAEFVAIGAMNYAAILPCVISAFVAVQITHLLGVVEEPLGIMPTGIEVGALELAKVAVIGLVVVVVSIVFCVMMHKTHDFASKLFKNKFLRVAVGGIIIVLLTLLVGNQNYNGAGLHVISTALAGEAIPWAFAMKMLFTAITLGFGFKGGEIFPSFFIGATLACTISTLIGFNPALGAGLGMICMFCCVTNAPISSIIMSVELFGSEYFFLFAIVCALGYALSGNFSLYDSQKILYSKLDGAERDVNTIENEE